MGFNFKALNSLIEFKYVTNLDLDNLSDEQLDDLGE